MDVVKAWSWRNAESVIDLCSSSQRYAFNRPCLPRLICVAPVQLSSRVDVRPSSQTPSSAAVFSRLFAPSRVCHVENRPMTPGVRVGKGLRMFVDLSFPLGGAAARFHVRRRAGAQLLEENQRFKSHLGLHGGMWSCVCFWALNKVVEFPMWAVVTALGLEDTMSGLPLRHQPQIKYLLPCDVPACLLSHAYIPHLSDTWCDAFPSQARHFQQCLLSRHPRVRLKVQDLLRQGMWERASRLRSVKRRGPS